MNDNTTTAAQPLDLDRAARLLLARYDEMRGDREPAAEFEILRDALIAHASAAQPESATGTTGYDSDMLRAWSFYMIELEQTVADLRAQLAEKDALLIKQFGVISDYQAQHYFNKDAPASAQPADDDCYCGGFGDVHNHGCPEASAQPDRGAAQDERALFEAALADDLKKEQGEFAMARGYSEGRPYTFLATKWAYRAWQAARAASPASQPIESSAVFLRQSSTFGPWIECKPSHVDAVRFVREDSHAVAPSDAKGKADAANAGGLPDYEAKFQASITELVMRHIDRMNDVCEQDTADNIIASFTSQFDPLFESYLAEKRGDTAMAAAPSSAAGKNGTGDQHE